MSINPAQNIPNKNVVIQPALNISLNVKDAQIPQQPVEPLIQKGANWRREPLPPNYEALDQALDQLYDKLPLNDGGKNKHIAIVVEKMEGNGDLLFGIQMAHLLKKMAPKATISLLTQDKDIALVKKLCGTEFADIKDLVEAIPNGPHQKKYDLILEGPGFSELHWSKLTQDRTKVVLLKEYGSGQYGNRLNFSHSMGFDKGEWGVIIDPTLARPVSREESLLQLQHMGLKETLLQGKTPAQYFTERDLYFGYSFALADEYINSVVALGSNKQQIDILLGGQEGIEDDSRFRFLLGQFAERKGGLQHLAKMFKHDPQLLNDALQSKDKIPKFLQAIAKGNRDLASRVTFLIETEKDSWQKQGIDQVEVILKDGKKLTIVLNPAAKKPKTLRLLFFPPIEHLDYKRLLVASEPLTLCTGDLSFSDAVSAHKMFLYEPLKHKGDFFKSMVALAAKEEPQIAAFLQARQKRDFAFIAACAKSPQFVQKFNAFCEKICTKYNVQERLLLKVKRHLAKADNPEIQVHEDNFFTAVEQNDRAATEKLNTLKIKLMEKKVVKSWKAPLLVTAMVTIPFLIKGLYSYFG